MARVDFYAANVTAKLKCARVFRLPFPFLNSEMRFFQSRRRRAGAARRESISLRRTPTTVNCVFIAFGSFFLSLLRRRTRQFMSCSQSLLAAALASERPAKVSVRDRIYLMNLIHSYRAFTPTSAHVQGGRADAKRSFARSEFETRQKSGVEKLCGEDHRLMRTKAPLAPMPMLFGCFNGSDGVYGTPLNYE